MGTPRPTATSFNVGSEGLRWPFSTKLQKLGVSPARSAAWRWVNPSDSRISRRAAPTFKLAVGNTCGISPDGVSGRWLCSPSG